MLPSYKAIVEICIWVFTPKITINAPTPVNSNVDFHKLHCQCCKWAFCKAIPYFHDCKPRLKVDLRLFILDYIRVLCSKKWYVDSLFCHTFIYFDGFVRHHHRDEVGSFEIALPIFLKAIDVTFFHLQKEAWSWFNILLLRYPRERKVH